MKRRALSLIPLLLLAVFGPTPEAVSPSFATEPSSRSALALARELPALRLFRQAYHHIQQKYVEPLEAPSLIARALEGLVAKAGSERLKLTGGPENYLLESSRGTLSLHLQGGSEPSYYQFVKAFRFVHSRVGSEIGAEELVRVAIHWMVRGLDPYSRYLRPVLYQRFQMENRGRYGGLGMRVSLRGGTLTVVEPFPEGPAHRAGLRAGDEILSIGGTSTSAMPLFEALRRLRGPVGTRVTLSLKRAGWPGPRDFTLVRELIEIRSTEDRFLPGRVAYLRVKSFHAGTGREVEGALKRFQRAGMRGLVLDLRDNPGGLLKGAVRVAQSFLPRGSLIVETLGRGPGQSVSYKAQRAPPGGKVYPMVVIINGGSASASEVLSGALRDNRRALLVGEPTFGKGTVQSIIPLEDGSALRLTTARYKTPSGELIEGKGITPHLLIGRARDKGKAPRAAPGNGKGMPSRRSADPEKQEGDLALQVAQRTLRQATSPELPELKTLAERAYLELKAMAREAETSIISFRRERRARPSPAGASSIRAACCP